MFNSIIVLTQYQGKIVGPIAWVLGHVISGIYEFFANFGITNAALCIFIFTFLMRALMIPIYYRQQLSSKLMSKMNPEIQAIQEKYKGKSDALSQQNMAMETQEVYQKYGSNPLLGCLPLLITFPIMIGLYQVIQNVPAYIPSIKEIYNTAAVAVQGQPGYMDVLKDVAAGQAAMRLGDAPTVNNVIDVLSTLNTEGWHQLAAGLPAIADTLNSVSVQVAHINNVFGLFLITDKPSFTSITIVIPILAAVFQWISMKIISANQPSTGSNDQAAAMTRNMNIVMTLMTVFWCFSFPVGIGIYWIAGSLFSLVQQIGFNKYFEKIDIDAMIEKNQKKAAEKKAKLIAEGKLPDPAKFNQYANVSTKSIANLDTASIGDKTSDQQAKKGITKKLKNYKITDYYRAEGEYHTSDISKVANMLKKD